MFIRSLDPVLPEKTVVDLWVGARRERIDVGVLRCTDISRTLFCYWGQSLTDVCFRGPPAGCSPKVSLLPNPDFVTPGSPVLLGECLVSVSSSTLELHSFLKYRLENVVSAGFRMSDHPLTGSRNLLRFTGPSDIPGSLKSDRREALGKNIGG